MSRERYVWLAGLSLSIVVTAWRPSDILDVPPPSGEFTSVAVQGPTAAAVPNGFVYNSVLEPNSSVNAGTYNLYAEIYDGSCADFWVSNVEGGNGLNFTSANDPRLVLNSELAETCDGQYNSYADSVFFYPLKFGLMPSSGLIPLATGLEARLIQAEAALDANDPATWLADLNVLRSSGCPDTATVNASCPYGVAQAPAQSSGLLPLTDPGTGSGRVSMLFQERAFWLFGTGERLSDMRRLIRQYGTSGQIAQDGFSANTVYPVGPYGLANTGIRSYYPTYGQNVEFSLPVTQEISTTNPNYKGRLTPTTTA